MSTSRYDKKSLISVYEWCILVRNMAYTSGISTPDHDIPPLTVLHLAIIPIANSSHFRLISNWNRIWKKKWLSQNRCHVTQVRLPSIFSVFVRKYLFFDWVTFFSVPTEVTFRRHTVVYRQIHIQHSILHLICSPFFKFSNRLLNTSDYLYRDICVLFIFVGPLHSVNITVGFWQTADIN